MKNLIAAGAATTKSEKFLLRKMPLEQNSCPVRHKPRMWTLGQSAIKGPSEIACVTLTKCGPFTWVATGTLENAHYSVWILT